MSYSLLSIFASLPRTTRGQFTQLGADPKGKNILYVNGNSVFIRSVDNPLECDVYTEHSHAVQVARYSASGFYIASADQSGKLRIWDTTNKEHLLKNEFQPLGGCIKDLQWSSDNQRLIVGGEGREKFGHVFNAETGTSVGEIMGTSKPINSVDFRPTRPFRAVVGSEDNTLCYFEGPPFKWKKSLGEHERFVNCVRYAPNGELFASGAADGRLFVYDGKTGEKLCELGAPVGTAHAGSIFALSWNAASNRILTVSGDKTAKVWDVEQKTLQKEFKFGDSIDDQQVGCLWMNDHLLTVSLSGQINYLNLNASSPADQILRTLRGHSKSLTALEIVQCATAPRIVSASHDGLMIHWNSCDGDMQSVNTAHKNQVQSLRFDTKNQLLLSVGFDDTLKLIDVNANFTLQKEIALNSQPQGLDVDLNGVAAVACINKLLILKERGSVVASLSLHYDATSVSITRNSNLIAVGGKDNKVHVYEFKSDNNTLTEVKCLQERDFVTAVRFSNNDEYLAVADNAKNVKCYRLDQNYADLTNNLWQYHAGRITSIAWSPDSKHLATSGVDTHCYVYSPLNRSDVVHMKNAHPLNPLTACAWLDNEHLITASQDCCLRKWKLNF